MNHASEDTTDGPKDLNASLGPVPLNSFTVEEAAQPVSGVSDPVTEEEPEREWWDDPSAPWRHKPTKTDIACLAWLGFMGIFGLSMLPLRAWLLGSPDRLVWLVALLGSRSGTAGLGSLASVGAQVPVVWPLLLGTLMSIKLDWVYWWAGKLWGRGMIEMWAAQSKRAARNYARAERWAKKLGWLGMFIAYVPIPLPIMQVVFVLAGAQGMSWKRFMVLDFCASGLWLVGYFVFGYAVGQPAVDLLTAYGKVANYVAIAMVVFIVIAAFRNSKKKG